MNKKAIDDKLKKWLEEEVEKENKIIEESVFSEGKDEQEEITEEELETFYEALMEKVWIREKEEREIRKEIRHVRKLEVRHRLAKTAGFVIVCTLAVFAASMTSEANRNYFVNSVKYLTGNDTKILIDNDESSDKPSFEEERVREEIEEKMDVEIPQFLYRPESFEFYDYTISKESGVVSLQYLYNKSVVSVYIGKEDEDIQSNGMSIHGDDGTVIYMSKENIPVGIVEKSEDIYSEKSYLAEWIHNGEYYQIIGRMPKAVFEKLIKEIVF